MNIWKKQRNEKKQDSTRQKEREWEREKENTIIKVCNEGEDACNNDMCV